MSVAPVPPFTELRPPFQKAEGELPCPGKEQPSPLLSSPGHLGPWWFWQAAAGAPVRGSPFCGSAACAPPQDFLGAVFLVLLQSLGDKTYRKDHLVRMNPWEKYFLGVFCCFVP